MGLNIQQRAVPVTYLRIKSLPGRHVIITQICECHFSFFFFSLFFPLFFSFLSFLCCKPSNLDTQKGKKTEKESDRVTR